MKISAKKMFASATLLAMLISTGAVLSADAATTKTTRYLKWEFTNNSVEDSEYTLSLDLYNGAQTRIIYPNDGGDNRYRSGNTGIVQIMSGDETCGTGFIIGDHTIATAAHCVYRTTGQTQYIISDPSIITYTDEGTPETITKNGQEIYNELKVTEIHIPYKYHEELQIPRELTYSAYTDYALLTVEEDLSDYVHFELGIPYGMNSNEFNQIELYTTGIPKFINGNRNFLVYTAKGAEHPYKDSTAKQIYHTCDLTDGQSGSPIYTATEYYYPGEDEPRKVYTAIAVVFGWDRDDFVDGTILYYNIGPCMDSEKLQFYQDNPYAST